MTLFRSKAEQRLAEKGLDPARLPPGQYLTLATWDFKVFGEVEEPLRRTTTTPTTGRTAIGIYMVYDATKAGTVVDSNSPSSSDAGKADAVQCREGLTSTDKKGNTTTSWSGDRCPHAGGIDQNIYGDKSPSRSRR